MNGERYREILRKIRSLSLRIERIEAELDAIERGRISEEDLRAGARVVFIRRGRFGAAREEGTIAAFEPSTGRVKLVALRGKPLTSSMTVHRRDVIRLSGWGPE